MIHREDVRIHGWGSLDEELSMMRDIGRQYGWTSPEVKMMGTIQSFKMILARSILFLGLSRTCLRNLCGIGRSIMLKLEWPRLWFLGSQKREAAIVVVIAWKSNDLVER